MDGISAMSAQVFAVNYDMAMLKKTMESVSQQAMSMINDLVEAVPAPSEYNFDVYGWQRTGESKKSSIPAPPGGRRDAVCIFYTGSAHCSLVALDQTTRFRPKRLAS